MENHPLRRHRFALTVSVGVVLFLVVVGTYIWTAPPLQRLAIPPKMVFDREVFVRRKPSDEARPWARTKDGTRLEVVSESGEWIEVRLNDRTTGWVRRDQGTIQPPPLAHPTPRQQAKQRLEELIRALHR